MKTKSSVSPISSICAHCSGPFVQHRYTGPRRRYCSEKCRHDHEYQRKPERTITCANPACSKLFQTRRSTQRFCSQACSGVYFNPRSQSPHPQLPTPTVGALNELIAATDLMRRGFHVFRALSPACECDLAFIHDSKLYRVEVKTAYRTMGGGASYGGKRDAANRYDILALVFNNERDEVLYQPELPS